MPKGLGSHAGNVLRPTSRGPPKARRRQWPRPRRLDIGAATVASKVQKNCCGQRGVE